MPKNYFSQSSVFFVLLVFIVSGCVHAKKDTLYQASTINALMQGVFDGDMTFGKLKRHGDIGLGTLDDLDGEMIEVDGVFYQIKTDGNAYKVNDKMETPFAVVTNFNPKFKAAVEKEMSYTELESYLDNCLKSKNILYAFRIDGKFKYIKTRSVPKQERPYPRLTEAVKKQVVFEFNDVEGTIIGFWCPQYAENINVPGYHFHFITKDRKKGGHLLDCRTGTVSIGIDETVKLSLVLPKTAGFNNADLIGSSEIDLKKVEKK